MTDPASHSDTVADFEPHRRALTGLAYRMLGSVSEAEDAVQDAYLRWHQADRDSVETPRAYLSRIVTRLCLDRLKQAQRRREIYVGEWLPEPLIGDVAQSDPDPETVASDVSVALMLALERLSPLERAAFLLHDVFDVGFDEVAATLGRNATACRQLASRARQHVRAARPRFDVPDDEADRLAEAFFAASRQGDVTDLRSLLADAAVLHSDGGGRRIAALQPIAGASNICRFFEGLWRKGRIAVPLWSERLTINGLTGSATVEADGTLQTTALEISKHKISAIYVTRNPDKLGHVAPRVPPALREGSGVGV